MTNEIKIGVLESCISRLIALEESTGMDNHKEIIKAQDELNKLKDTRM